MTVNPIPIKGVIPYLSCRNASEAIEFYQRAFGAVETMRMAGPDGKIGHAELLIGDANVYLADEHPDIDFLSPQSRGGAGLTLHMYVPDVDAFFTRAEAAGAKITRPVADQFYGDRQGMLVDPYGHVWSLATHIEDVTPEEMDRRAKEMFG